MDIAFITPKYWANIYSLLRTADGLGFNKLFIVDCKTHIPKRGTMAFRKGKEPWNKIEFIDTIQEFINRSKDLILVSLELTNESIPLSSYQWKDNSILILGHEALGVPKELLDISEKVEIPMKGKVRCMNVACAGSIAMYDYILKNQ